MMWTLWAASSLETQDDSEAKSTNWLSILSVKFVFNFIFLASVWGKQAFFVQLPSFAKLKEF